MIVFDLKIDQNKLNAMKPGMLIPNELQRKSTYRFRSRLKNIERINYSIFRSDARFGSDSHTVAFNKRQRPSHINFDLFIFIAYLRYIRRKR